MTPNLFEWTNLGLRWLHLIAGIMWIGSSFFFVWLDSNLECPEQSEKKSLEGELWMVHSGGFYQVQKLKPGPDEMPQHLHWFKWEAAFTWLFGFLLLAIVYYTNNCIYLIDKDVFSISPIWATVLSLFILVVSWFVYDLFWQSALANNGKPAGCISLVLLFVGIYGLCHVFSGRAAFIHVGAVLGTLMVLNVWVRILPAQQQMIDATKRGEMPDFELGKHAKRRSMHNSYMTLPVLFMMLSNHYANAFGAEHNWLVLSLLVIVGAAIRFRMISKDKRAVWIWVPTTACIIALYFLTLAPTVSLAGYKSSGSEDMAAVAGRIIENRCLRCHSANPTDEDIQVAPAGVMFDTPELVEAYADRIKARAVVSRTMPLGNKTGMTNEERSILGSWIDRLSPAAEGD